MTLSIMYIGIGDEYSAVTHSAHHGGRYFDRVLAVEDSCYALCPPKKMLRLVYTMYMCILCICVYYIYSRCICIYITYISLYSILYSMSCCAVSACKYVYVCF